MRNFLALVFPIIVILFTSCGNVQTQETRAVLTATEFEATINKFPSGTVIDVRTPEEYSKGHLAGAVNYDWNSTGFETHISKLDKTNPVFVYCLSGGRSSAAARKMQALGFTQVYELEGGILKWRAANLHEVSNDASGGYGMSRQHFDSLLMTNKLVLIDFYADWCAPCKKMKPYLDEISTDMSDKVVVIRINVDDNQSLCKELKIDELPVLQLYKDRKLTWSNTGFIEKESVVNKLN